MGAGNILISGDISNANGYAVSIVKTGPGVLNLSAANTYSGFTTVSNGTLSLTGSLNSLGGVTIAGGLFIGNGTINGPVALETGGTLEAGTTNTIGTLTLGSTLTLSGNTLVKINPDTTGSDLFSGETSVTYGGTLAVTNLGGALAAGDSFKIFSANNYHGSFASLNLPPTGVGLVWNTNSLTNGVLSVVLGTVTPRFGQISFQGTNLLMSCTGGAAGYCYSVLSTTNLAMPLTNWSLISTGFFDSNGDFTFSTNINPQLSEQFYQLELP
jgi:autotransporter-associated beta strand protein